jgi:hypothetical protein
MSVAAFKSQQKKLVEEEEQHRKGLEYGLELVEMKIMYELSKTLPNLEVVGVSQMVKDLPWTPYSQQSYRIKKKGLKDAIKHSKCKQKFLTYAYRLEIDNCIKYHKKLLNYEVDIIEECNKGKTRVITTDMSMETINKKTGETERLLEASTECKKAYEYREKVMDFVKRQ